MSQSSVGLMISLSFWSIILLGLALFLYNLGVLAYEGVVGKVGIALSFYSGPSGREYTFFWVRGFCVLGWGFLHWGLGVLRFGLGVYLFVFIVRLGG